MHIAYCGINCESCKMYKATINDDSRLRQELAKEWSSLYKRNLDILKMHCLGCKSKLVYELCNKCDIKGCNQNKKIEKCNSCEEYSSCDRIKNFKNWQLTNNTGVEIVF